MRSAERASLRCACRLPPGGDVNYAIAPQGIFFSLQGEGRLRGSQMAFCRLAGCSVGCSSCDTDYSVAERMSAEAVAHAVGRIMPAGLRDPWVWLTGGEPYDRDLTPLFRAFRARGLLIAVATSGVHHAQSVDWLSVSPHGLDIAQRYGDEIKLVDGLNGLDLHTWLEANPDSSTDFQHRYVQPLSRDGDEGHSSLARCLEFLRGHPNWALSRQDHIHWRVS